MKKFQIKLLVYTRKVIPTVNIIITWTKTYIATLVKKKIPLPKPKTDMWTIDIYKIGLFTSGDICALFITFIIHENDFLSRTQHSWVVSQYRIMFIGKIQSNVKHLYLTKKTSIVSNFPVYRNQATAKTNNKS